jgi:hypothetical protein
MREIYGAIRRHAEELWPDIKLSIAIFHDGAVIFDESSGLEELLRITIKQSMSQVEMGNHVHNFLERVVSRKNARPRTRD